MEEFLCHVKQDAGAKFNFRRRKMKRKPKVPKERNPFVAHLATKPSGAHGKSNKAKRKLQKQKDLADLPKNRI